MNEKKSGQRVLITGGAKGIGAETARLFAEDGAKIIYLIDIDDSNGKKIEKDLAMICDCKYRHLDVTDEAGVAELFAEV